MFPVLMQNAFPPFAGRALLKSAVTYNPWRVAISGRLASLIGNSISDSSTVIIWYALSFFFVKSPLYMGLSTNTNFPTQSCDAYRNAVFVSSSVVVKVAKTMFVFMHLKINTHSVTLSKLPPVHFANFRLPRQETNEESFKI
jgi:hypothetical protein